MTTWNTIEKDGAPKDGVLVWVWLARFQERYILRRLGGDWVDLYRDINYMTLLTDRWTPIIPPDPPEED